jgi:REP element-mobilizing transposase RayT
MESGSIYFFTSTNLEWKHLLKNEHHKLIVINSLRFLVNKNKLKIYAFVIMPNRIHLIWSIGSSPIKT